MGSKNNKRKAYLVGGMEKAPRQGATWRKDMASFLSSLGFEVIDPVLKEYNLKNDNTKKWYSDKKNMKSMPQFQNKMRQIIDLDLDVVQDASHNIILWDKYAAAGAGSQGEVTYGYRLWSRRNKPIQYLIINGMPLKHVPGWILGCVQKIFTSKKDFKEYMLKNYSLNNND